MAVQPLSPWSLSMFVISGLWYGIFYCLLIVQTMGNTIKSKATGSKRVLQIMGLLMFPLGFLQAASPWLPFYVDWVASYHMTATLISAVFIEMDAMVFTLQFVRQPNGVPYKVHIRTWVLMLGGYIVWMAPMVIALIQRERWIMMFSMIWGCFVCCYLLVGLTRSFFKLWMAAQCNLDLSTRKHPLHKMKVRVLVFDVFIVAFFLYCFAALVDCANSSRGFPPPDYNRAVTKVSVIIQAMCLALYLWRSWVALCPGRAAPRRSLVLPGGSSNAFSRRMSSNFKIAMGHRSSVGPASKNSAHAGKTSVSRRTTPASQYAVSSTRMTPRGHINSLRSQVEEGRHSLATTLPRSPLVDSASVLTGRMSATPSAGSEPSEEHNKSLVLGGRLSGSRLKRLSSSGSKRMSYSDLKRLSCSSALESLDEHHDDLDRKATRDQRNDHNHDGHHDDDKDNFSATDSFISSPPRVSIIEDQYRDNVDATSRFIMMNSPGSSSIISLHEGVHGHNLASPPSSSIASPHHYLVSPPGCLREPRGPNIADNANDANVDIKPKLRVDHTEFGDNIELEDDINANTTNNNIRLLSPSRPRLLSPCRPNAICVSPSMTRVSSNSISRSRDPLLHEVCFMGGATRARSSSASMNCNSSPTTPAYTRSGGGNDSSSSGGDASSNSINSGGGNHSSRSSGGFHGHDQVIIRRSSGSSNRRHLRFHLNNIADAADDSTNHNIDSPRQNQQDRRRSSSGSISISSSGSYDQGRGFTDHDHSNINRYLFQRRGSTSSTSSSASGSGNSSERERRRSSSSGSSGGGRLSEQRFETFIHINNSSDNSHDVEEEEDIHCRGEEEKGREVGQDVSVFEPGYHEQQRPGREQPSRQDGCLSGDMSPMLQMPPVQAKKTYMSVLQPPRARSPDGTN